MPSAQSAAPDPQSSSWRRRRSTSSTQPASTPSGTKRSRTGYACEACRNRKIACNGASPCGRCVQDERECVYVDRPTRTPLTRVRMTELEERLAFYENLWDSLSMGSSLSQAHTTYLEHGFTTARDFVLRQRPPRQTLPTFSSIYNAQAQSSATVGMAVGDTNVTGLGATENDPTEDEWDPSHATRAAESSDGIANTAESIVETTAQGVSYLGLSSGTTFVNVIKRLTPDLTLPAFPGNHAERSDILGPTTDRAMVHSSGSVQRLPPLSEILPFVDCYFNYSHTITPLVHEPTIRAQISGALPLSPKSGDDVLLYMIFAMGALDLSTDNAELSLRYYQYAHKALQHRLLTDYSLQLVQGLAIMAPYLQRSNQVRAGHLMLGLAIRLAVGLGLHTTLGHEHCSPLEKEMRTRVWWALVVLEAGSVIAFARPLAISAAQLGGIPLPINCHDEDLTVSTTHKPGDSTEATVYAALIYQGSLARVICHVHEAILASPTSPSPNLIKEYDDMILSAVESLPRHYRQCPDGPYRYSFHVQTWRIRDFRGMLHRPFLLAAAWDAKSGPGQPTKSSVIEIIDVCRSLALDNLYDIGHYLASENSAPQIVEWYALYFAYQSALTILLSLVWEPSHDSAEIWRSAIHSTTAWFRQTRSLNQMGLAYADMLEKVLDALPDPGDRAPRPAEFPDQSARGSDRRPPRLAADRYWWEIMGNQSPLPDMKNPSGWWDQLGQALPGF